MKREEAVEVLKERYLTCVGIGLDNHANRVNEALDMAIEALSADGDLISRADAIEAVCMNDCGGCRPNECGAYLDKSCDVVKALSALPSAEAVQRWIPCSERLPKVNQRVLLATNDGRVFVGYREKPDLVWQVTEKDGRKHWVYDPENYTDDIEILPKNEDCGFSKDDVYSDGFLSVASVNYDDRFVGVTAWMPLPKPYREDGEKE